VAKEMCKRNEAAKGRVNREMKERYMALLLLCYKIVSKELSVSVDEEV
jgi:hypothetical protein